MGKTFQAGLTVEFDPRQSLTIPLSVTFGEPLKEINSSYTYPENMAVERRE
jgi:hypothetical protein